MSVRFATCEIGEISNDRLTIWLLLCERMSIMKLHDYLARLTPEQRKDFAARSKIQEGYLKQLKCRTPGNQHRVPSVALCRRFVAVSNGVLTLEELRPDVWDPQAIVSESAA